MYVEIIIPLTHGKLIGTAFWKQNKIRQLNEPFVLDKDKLKCVSITKNIREFEASDNIEEILSEAVEHEGTHFNLTSIWHYILWMPYR